MIKDFISRHKFAVGFLCGISLLPILFAILLFLTFGRQMAVWQSYQFTIPETQSQLNFQWKPVHPFLAEYDRKVQVISDGRESPTFWLVTNTGGRHHLNLYILKIENEKWVRIVDEYSECVINLKTFKGYSVGRKFGKAFIAPPSEQAYWGYSWQDNNTETVEAQAGEEKGTHDQRFYLLGKYIGSLDARSNSLRFIPASERPEEHIKTMEEQSEEMEKNLEQNVQPGREKQSGATR
jgi:hypothetical protein